MQPEVFRGCFRPTLRPLSLVRNLNLVVAPRPSAPGRPVPPAPSALPRPSSPPPAPPQPVRRRPARPAPSRHQHRAHPSPGTGRQKADGGAGRQELHWLLAPCAGALYPLPRRSASLGPASGQTDRGTMGPSRSSGWRDRDSPGPDPSGQRVAAG